MNPDEPEDWYKITVKLCRVYSGEFYGTEEEAKQKAIDYFNRNPHEHIEQTEEAEIE